MYFKQSVGCIGVIFLTGVLSLTGPQDTVQYVGSEATLNCSNNANNIIEWSDFITITTGNRIFISSSGLVGTHPNAGSYRVDERTSNGVEHYNLNIITTRSTDAGKYGCKRTLLDSTFQTANLLVVDNFAVTTNKSANSEFREGDSVRLECKVEKYGNTAKKPSIQWYDGNVMLSGSATEVVDGARTTFTNVAVKLLSPADNGKVFACRMSFTASDNIVLPTGFTTEKSTGVMNVQYAPKVVNINPKQSGYFENDQVNCSATGNPRPSVTWSPSGSSTNGNGYSVLTISQSMHGQAYTCAASNVIGSLDETLTIAIATTTTPTTTTVPTTTPTTEGPTTAGSQKKTTPAPISQAAIYGIVGAVAGVIVILIIIIGICWFRKRQKKDAPPAPEQHKEQHVLKPVNEKAGYDNFNREPDLVQGRPDPIESQYANVNKKPLNEDDPRYRNVENLHYADLSLDDTPRSRKPIQLYDDGTEYAEIQRV